MLRTMTAFMGTRHPDREEKQNLQCWCYAFLAIPMFVVSERRKGGSMGQMAKTLTMQENRFDPAYQLRSCAAFHSRSSPTRFPFSPHCPVHQAQKAINTRTKKSTSNPQPNISSNCEERTRKSKLNSAQLNLRFLKSVTWGLSTLPTWIFANVGWLNRCRD